MFDHVHSIEKDIDSIKFLLENDEHDNVNLSSKIREYFYSIYINHFGKILLTLYFSVFHCYSYLTVKKFYENHLPHYDSIGSLTGMFYIINTFKQDGIFEAFNLSRSSFLSWGQSFFAFLAAPFLDTTPESMQLYNSLCIVIFSISVFIAAKTSGANEIKAFLVSLIVFLPDTFYSWQGGLLDLRRDPAFLSLLGATFFMFFAYIWGPEWKKGIFLGIVAGLTGYSRGNALYFIISIMAFPLFIWAITILKNKDYNKFIHMIKWSIIPFLILSVPNIFYTFIPNFKRHSNPYVSYGFVSDPWESLSTYWNMPLKLMFGTIQGYEGDGTFFITSFFILGLLFFIFILMYFRFLKINLNFLKSYLYIGFLLSALWTILSTMFLLCIILKWMPMSFHNAKCPFFPSLIGLVSFFFVLFMSIEVGLRKIKIFFVYAIVCILCVTIFSFSAYKIDLKSPPVEPKRHVEIAHELSAMIKNLNVKQVAFIWFELINIDTLNYYLATKGSKKKISKFLYKSPDGYMLDFATGVPPNTDIKLHQTAIKEQIEKRADFVIVNINPASYANKTHHFFIFRYGQEIIESILKNDKFKKIYSYELWADKAWKSDFVVLKNMSLTLQ